MVHTVLHESLQSLIGSGWGWAEHDPPNKDTQCGADDKCDEVPLIHPPKVSKQRWPCLGKTTAVGNHETERCEYKAECPTLGARHSPMLRRLTADDLHIAMGVHLNHTTLFGAGCFCLRSPHLAPRRRISSPPFSRWTKFSPVEVPGSTPGPSCAQWVHRIGGTKITSSWSGFDSVLRV